MTRLEILDLQIARARAHFREKTNIEYLASARQIVDAAAHCGQPVTLNANQCRALAIFLESEAAMREVRALHAVHAPNVIPARFGQN